MANKNNGFRNVGLALVFASAIALASGIVLGTGGAGVVKDMDREIVAICDESSTFSLDYAEHLHTLNTKLQNKQITQQEYDKTLNYYNGIEFKRRVVYSLPDVDTSNLDALHAKLDVYKSARSTALTLGIVAGAGAALALKQHAKNEKKELEANKKLVELETIAKDLDELESQPN